MSKAVFRHLLMVMALLVGAPTWADKAPLQFSAEAVQVQPQRPPVVARIFVGAEAVRTEYLQGNQALIEIVVPAAKRRVTLIPEKRVYLESSDGSLKNIALANTASKATPCAGQAQVSCRLLGREKINGLAVEKWEFVSTRSGRPARTLHWIDVERRLPIREFFQDGTVTEMRLVENERRNGRATEKWELTVTNPGGEPSTAHQWYDPALKITIREEAPGGYVRELKNIKVGPQAAKLFAIPAGYKKMEPAPPSPDLVP